MSTSATFQISVPNGEGPKVYYFLTLHANYTDCEATEIEVTPVDLQAAEGCEIQLPPSGIMPPEDPPLAAVANVTLLEEEN